MMTPGTVYIARGHDSSLSQIESLLTASGISMRGADAYVRSFTHFGVDDARTVVGKAQLSSVGAHRVFVLVVASITTEAQNALLKTFEEAPGDALFVLVVPSPDTLLPTLRSRSQTLALRATGESTIDIAEFCAASPDDRITMLKPLLEKGDEDRRDTGALLQFLSSLERALAPRVQDAQVRASLAVLYKVRGFMSDKGALIKTLLETVAYTVPRV